MKPPIAMLVLFLTFLLGSTACSAQSDGKPPDNSTIPPDILRQMDPGLVSGQRPKIASVKQEDIFGLRDKPRLDADLVCFNFDPKALSTAQRNILDAWIRGGHNKIYLLDRDIVTYAGVFGLSADEEFAYARWSEICPVLRDFTLADHSVSTDCGHLLWGYCATYAVRDETADGKFSVHRDYLKDLDTQTARVLVFAKSDPSKALCGAFPFGRNTVYFHNQLGGSDSRRWYLNFMHFALDLRVPGAAETGASTSGEQGDASRQQDDVIVLKNGDKITGEVLNKTFTMKTSYATLTFDREKVDLIVLEGAGFNIDEMVLKAGDKLSGVLQDSKISMKLSSGAEAELDRDKIKEIRILKMPAATPEPADNNE